MNVEKFTPGPWHIKKSEEIRSPYGGNVSSTRITILDTPGGQYQSRHVIAQVAKGNGRGEANAALIAAAPEMYEFILWIRSVQGQCAIMKWRKFLPEILDKADEILRKAEGEE